MDSSVFAGVALPCCQPTEGHTVIRSAGWRHLPARAGSRCVRFEGPLDTGTNQALHPDERAAVSAARGARGNVRVCTDRYAGKNWSLTLQSSHMRGRDEISGSKSKGHSQ